MIDAVYARLTPADVELTIFRIQDRAERDRFFTRLPARRNVDALIVASFALTPTERSRLQSLGVPLVYLNQRVRGVPSVAIDDVAGARDGVRGLLALGHRRIAFVRSVSPAPGLQLQRRPPGRGVPQRHGRGGRRRGRTSSSSPRGTSTPVTTCCAPPSPTRTRRPRWPWTPTSSPSASSPPLVRAGLRAPDDLSLLGFDDHALAGRLGLSTVAQPAALTATEAATLALALAAGETPPRRTILVPTRLVLRSTTGPAGPRAAA